MAGITRNTCAAVLRRLAAAPFILLLWGATPDPLPAQVVIPAGVPLRVQVDKGTRLKVGNPVAGRLTAPVYVGDRLVLPKDVRLGGTITETVPIPRGERWDSMLNGDFTPLHTPVVAFTAVTMPDGTSLPLSTRATERTAEMVRLGGSGQGGSILTLAKRQIAEKRAEVRERLEAPEKMDRLRRFLYAQLPYHPQEIWAGTQFDAELLQPVPVPEAEAGRSAPETAGQDTKLTGTLMARLNEDLDSPHTRKGQIVTAIVTEPLMDAQRKQIVLPEGTHLVGSVIRASPARSFGRNGALRFTFRQVVPPQGAAQAAHGQIVAAEGSGSQNLSIDEEGGVKAHADPGRILAPLVLTLLAAQSMDRNGSAVAKGAVVSNGFGVVARVVGMAASNRNVASGFAYYGLAKSVYKRYVARGHNVTFPRNTQLSIQLSDR